MPPTLVSDPPASARSEPRAPAGAPLRTPPHNYEAEQALLGAILANNRAYEKVSEFLRREHFADPVHGLIYEAAGRLIERGQIANPVTLKNAFEQAGSLEEVGGTRYLGELLGAMISVVDAAEYGRLVHDLALRRQLIALGEDLVNESYAAEVDASAGTLIETTEQRLFDLANAGHYDGGFQSFGQALKQALTSAETAYKRDSHVVGVTTGLKGIDAKLGGLHPSDLVILAGRPSMGKTALATKMAYSAAAAYREAPDEDGRSVVKEGAKVAFFSLEMSAEQLATRLLSERTAVPSDKIRRGEVKGEDFPRFVAAAKELAGVPLFIDDTPALTMSALRTRARRLMRQQGLGLIVVDYLQLLRPSAGSQPENRVQEISEVTRGLKAIAKELNVPVLALSQLSRAVEQREDKRPQLSDLRESGSIEQDADVVMFIFRESYYLERTEPMRRSEEKEETFLDRMQRWRERCEEVWNTAEVLVAKQRNGPTGKVALFFDGNLTRFADLDRQHDPDDHA
ncbi:MAG: replicative DNA helicase [Proteobacteria bacterium]|nr:replicative DNA helicase [Pseudomonadota bacterium]